jgi:hypothetical protein
MRAAATVLIAVSVLVAPAAQESGASALRLCLVDGEGGNAWQLHVSQLSGQEYTPPGRFIANLTDTPAQSMPIAPLAPPARGAPGVEPPPVPDGDAFWLEAMTRGDGSFPVTNGRNGFAKSDGTWR